jgi:MFS family permease
MPFLIVVAAAGVYSGLIMTDSASLTAGIVATAQERLRGATLAMQQVIGFSGGAIGTVVVGWVLDLSGGQQSHGAWILACVTMATGSLMGVIVMRLASESINHSVSTK